MEHKEGEFWLSATQLLGAGMDLSALRRVQFDKMLQLCGITRDGAALMSLHVPIRTAVAEDKARCGQGCGVDASFVAQGTHSLQFG